MSEIETERLVLKKIGPHDLTRLMALIGDVRVSKTLSRVPHPYTEEDARYWLDVVEHKDLVLSDYLDETLIGGVGLDDKKDGGFELGYWLGVEYWGRGYATEAVRGLLDYARMRFPNKLIKADIFVGNVASSNVLEKVGFTPIGNSEVFSVSRQETVKTRVYEYARAAARS